MYCKRSRERGGVRSWNSTETTRPRLGKRTTHLISPSLTILSLKSIGDLPPKADSLRLALDRALVLLSLDDVLKSVSLLLHAFLVGEMMIEFLLHLLADIRGAVSRSEVGDSSRDLGLEAFSNASLGLDGDSGQAAKG